MTKYRFTINGAGDAALLEYKILPGVELNARGAPFKRYVIQSTKMLVEDDISCHCYKEILKYKDTIEEAVEEWNTVRGGNYGMYAAEELREQMALCILGQ